MKNAEIKVGDTLNHETHGDVKVIKVTKRQVTVSNAEDEILKVKAAELSRAVAEGDTKQSATNKAEAAESADTEGLDEDAPEDGTSMKNQMNRFRVNYVDTVSHSGNKSQSNGDEVALTLAGLSGAQVCKVAMECIEGLDDDLIEKYEHLNEGQRRMNAGNRIRAAVTRDEPTANMAEVKASAGNFHAVNKDAAKARADEATAEKAQAELAKKDAKEESKASA
jgi:hypothetical protein